MTSRPATDRVVNATVLGSAADRAGNGDQNAVAVRDDIRVGATIVAIAGAHGRLRQSRSDIGARIAADIGATKAEAAVAALPSNDAVALDTLAEVLATRIAEQWHTQVGDHVVSQATTSNDEQADSLSSYATALLLVIVTPAAVLALQLGDGDIVVRTEDGEIVRPIPGDGASGASGANDADSLSQDDARARFRHAVVDRTARDVALVLVAAGFDAASADPEWRTTFTADVIAQAEKDGIDAVDRQLPTRIADTARVDGDDVTVALVFPSAATPAAAGAPVVDATDPRLATTVAQPALAGAAATAGEPVAATSVHPAVAASANEPRRRRWIMAAIATGAVLLATAAVLALSRGNGSTAPDTTVTTTPATTHATTTPETSPSTGSGPSTAVPSSAPPATAAPSTAPPATTVPVVVTVPTTAAPPRTTTPTQPPATTTPTTPPRTTVPPTTASPPTT